jgi:DNA-binding NarL/FixJ family response regulator
MKVLIVEDDPSTLEALQQELETIPAVTVKIARSSGAALQLLQTDFFDLVINDLKLPTTDGALDADVAHGLAVHAYVQEHSEGTPVLVFSGFGTLQLATDLYEKSTKCDVWGSGAEVHLTRYLHKDQMRECLKIVTDVADQLAAVESIEISTGVASLRLTPSQRRILQLFGRLTSGANIQVRPLGGGLSDTSVFRITVEDKKGAPSSYAVAKIAAIRVLADEHSRYQRFVAPVMVPGSFAPVIRFCNAGAWNYGGLFYSLASAHDQALFDILSVNAQRAANFVKKLQMVEHPWPGVFHLRFPYLC